MLKIKLPNNKEVELDPAALGNLTAEQQANVAGFINALGKPDPVVAPAPIPPTAPAIETASAQPQRSSGGITRPSSQSPQRQRSGGSNRVPRPELLPADADPVTRAKIMLLDRPRSHRSMDMLLVRAGSKGVITTDFTDAIGVSRSEVSRAISGLRKIEQAAPLIEQTLLREVQEGRFMRWYAGLLLIKLIGGQPETQPSQDGAAAM